MREPSPDRRAVRAAGKRRVQTVTTWTAAGSVVAAAVLTAALAHGTQAQRQAATTPQLQAPQTAPGFAGPDDSGDSGGDGGLHIGSGGS